ncbi:MAG: hypothetical protein ACXAB7_09740 [Candidatus Kariarchaeaceae archaeon]|jgi:hypothetical protein
MVKKTRTLRQRAEAIYSLLDKYDIVSQPVPKSQFKEVGISPKDIENWIDLIQFIQSMPLLIVKKMGKRTYVDTIENKFMILMKKHFLDKNRDLIERESAVLLYFRSLLTIEKLKGKEVTIEELVDSNWNIDRPTIKRIAEDALSN